MLSCLRMCLSCLRPVSPSPDCMEACARENLANGVAGCCGLSISHWLNFFRPPWSSQFFSVVGFCLSAFWYALWSSWNDARLVPISDLTR